MDIVNIVDIYKLLSFVPLFHKLARKYAGRGAEPEDLFQTAALGFLQLAQKHADSGGAVPWLLYLSRRLPPIVRDEAERLRKQRAPLSLDALHDLGYDAEAPPVDEPAIIPKVHLLTDREQEILLLLSQGYTQRDIAHELNITPQAVNATIKRARRKITTHNTIEAFPVRDG